MSEHTFRAEYVNHGRRLNYGCKCGELFGTDWNSSQAVAEVRHLKHLDDLAADNSDHEGEVSYAADGA